MQQMRRPHAQLALLVTHAQPELKRAALLEVFAMSKLVLLLPWHRRPTMVTSQLHAVRKNKHATSAITLTRTLDTLFAKIAQQALTATTTHPLV